VWVLDLERSSSANDDIDYMLGMTIFQLLRGAHGICHN